MWPALNPAGAPQRVPEAPAVPEPRGVLVQGPWAPAPEPAPPPVPATAFRVFLAHGIHVEDDTIDFWCKRLQDQIQGSAGSAYIVTVISGRDAFKRMSGARPGKKVWARYAQEIATGYTDTFPISPSYQLYIVPAPPERPFIGRGTAGIVNMAIDIGRPVRLWDPESGNDWGVSGCQCVDGKNAAFGYQLLPRG